MAAAALIEEHGITSQEAAASTSSPNQQQHPPPTFPAESHPRLSIATPNRLLFGSVASCMVGFSLGALQGGQMAQLRFRAEHAHKMPDSTTGWYFYHKSKNYHAMQGGIREGFRMTAKTGFWSFVALSLESTVDRCRGSSDMFSTIIATLSVAGTFSLWRKFWNFFFFLFPLFPSLAGLGHVSVFDLLPHPRFRRLAFPSDSRGPISNAYFRIMFYPYILQSWGLPSLIAYMWKLWPSFNAVGWERPMIFFWRHKAIIG